VFSDVLLVKMSDAKPYLITVHIPESGLSLINTDSEELYIKRVSDCITIVFVRKVIVEYMIIGGATHSNITKVSFFLKRESSKTFNTCITNHILTLKPRLSDVERENL